MTDFFQISNSIPGFLAPAFLLLTNFLSAFWWLFLLIILYNILTYTFIYYMCTTWNSAPERRRILLEIKIPQSVTRPLRAMEMFFNAYWTTYDPPKDWRGVYFEGKTIVEASFELVGIEGTAHFYIRIPAMQKRFLESTLYAQYPEIEIFEVPDYTQTLPKEIPNKDWDIWGCDFQMNKPDIYPIRTYSEFFEEKTDTLDEAKRLDPVSNILELFSKLKKGEYIWFQITALPIQNKEDNFLDRGAREIDRLMKREKPAKSNPFILDIIWGILTEVPLKIIDLFFPVTFREPEEVKKQELFPEAMRMSTGERDVVTAIEKKISKTMYQCNIRFLQLSRIEVFDHVLKGFGPSFTVQFGTHNTNNIRPLSTTITKVQSPELFKNARLYYRKRELFWRYVDRERPPVKDGIFILNSEELATMFHFPGYEVAPSVGLTRIEVKKVAPPASLPIEE